MWTGVLSHSLLKTTTTKNKNNKKSKNKHKQTNNTLHPPLFSLQLLFQRCPISRVCSEGRCCTCTWEETISSPKVAVTRVFLPHLHWAPVELLPECCGTTTPEAATLLNIQRYSFPGCWCCSCPRHLVLSNAARQPWALPAQQLMNVYHPSRSVGGTNSSFLPLPPMLLD